MITTPKALRDSLHFDNESQLDTLRSLCREYVSSDIHFDGSPAEQFANYQAFIKDYLENFLPNCPADQKDRESMNGFPALLNASYKGYDRYILSLTGLSPNVVNHGTSTGITPLHSAAAGGHPQIVDFLLKKGADASKLNQNGRPPLFNALLLSSISDKSHIGKKTLVFKQLNKAAPGFLSHQDNSEDTVFHLMAVHPFNILFAEVMKENPDAIFLHNNSWEYPIHTAVLNQQLEIIELLMAIPGVSTLKNTKGQTALHYAARYGKPDVVQQCCKDNANIEVVDEANKTPLLLAVESNNIEAVKILIKQGADLTAVDKHGHTILHMAVDTLNEDLISLILGTEGIQINLLDDHRQTPLARLTELYSLEPGFERIEQLLLDRGATNGLSHGMG